MQSKNKKVKKIKLLQLADKIYKKYTKDKALDIKKVRDLIDYSNL